jgi:DNA-binding PadR family transcriptional regulator
MQSPLSARAALLHVLDYPAHGLELIRRVRERTGGGVSLKQGSVYPALRQLERERLVRSWTGRSAKGGGRPRRYYELTPNGVKAAMVVKDMVAGFVNGTPPPPPSPREVEHMRERLRRCAEVSAFCMKLRQALLRATGS